MSLGNEAPQKVKAEMRVRNEQKWCIKSQLYNIRGILRVNPAAIGS